MKTTILAILTALLMSIGLLAAAIYIPATASWVMRPLMAHYSPPEDTRLPAEEYAPVVSMITRYLQGDEIPFQHVFTVDGAEYAAFNAKEQQHMADVQDLFSLCRWIGWGCTGAIVLIGLALRKNMSWRTFRCTLLVILGAVTAIILLACIDFNSLFVLFHQIAFTNDLWLLDPRTDLLILLMPIEFFISYAAIIGGLWLAGMVAMLVVSTIIINKPNKPKGE